MMRVSVWVTRSSLGQLSNTASSPDSGGSGDHAGRNRVGHGHGGSIAWHTIKCCQRHHGTMLVLMMVHRTGFSVPGVVTQHWHTLNTSDGPGPRHQHWTHMSQLRRSHHGVANHHGVSCTRHLHVSAALVVPVHGVHGVAVSLGGVLGPRVVSAAGAGSAPVLTTTSLTAVPTSLSLSALAT